MLIVLPPRRLPAGRTAGGEKVLVLLGGTGGGVLYPGGGDDPGVNLICSPPRGQTLQEPRAEPLFMCHRRRLLWESPRRVTPRRKTKAHPEDTGSQVSIVPDV